VLIGGGAGPARAERPGGVPGGRGGSGPGGQRPRGREAIFFVLGFIGIAAPALGTDGPPRTWGGWFLVVIGAVAGSLAVTSLRDVLLTGISRLPTRSQLWRWAQAGVASAAALGLLVGVGIGVSRAYGYGRALLRDCDVPLEVPIVTDTDTARTVGRLAGEFERVTADDQGCPPAHLTVFTGPRAQVRSAILNGWDVVAGAEPVVRGPLRDIGPRPLVWLPSTTIEVDRLIAEAPQAGGVVPFARPAIWARTPMVLAAPAGVTPPAAAGPQVQVQSLLADDVTVVRPDPAVSSAGELAVVASLGPPPGRSQPETEAHQLEHRLARELPRRGYPLGDASAVLGAYRELSCQEPQKVAIFLPRQFVVRPDLAGAPLDGDCGAGDRDLAVLGSDPGLTFELPAVLLDWPDTGGDAATATARRFRDWLLSAEGRREVTAAGLQPSLVAQGQTGDQEPPGESWPEAMNPALLDRVQAALEFQGLVRRHARVVIALDSSLSMATSLTAAQGVVDDFVARLGEEDQVGLFTFGRRTTTPVPPGPAGPASASDTSRDHVRRASLTVSPGGETPLWTGIDGAAALLGPERTGPDEPAAAVLVVTDGRIALGEALRAAAKARVGRAGARVFLVAVGGVGCDGRLTAVARELDGRCAEPGDRAPGGGMDGVAAAIWGAVDDR
jgi:hypothetical protein